MGRSWRRRWCVLSSCLLVMFEDETEKVPTNMIVIQGKDKTLVNGDSLDNDDVLNKLLVFAIDSSDERYFFQACDAYDYNEWNSAIKTAIRKGSVVGMISASAEAPKEGTVPQEGTASDKDKAEVANPLDGRLIDSKLLDILQERGCISSIAAQRLQEGGRFDFDHFERFYENKKEIGSGSFGNVFLSQQIRTGKEVAVKMLTKSLEAKHCKVLNCEVSCMQRLNIFGCHPNIVELFEIMESSSSVYFVMELLKGRDLMEIIFDRVKSSKSGGIFNFKRKSSRRSSQEAIEKEGDRSPSSTRRLVCLREAEAAHITSQITEGVKWLHYRGIVHRDLKPENVYVTLNGEKDSFELENVRVKLIDFGFAKCFPFSEKVDDLPSPSTISPTSPRSIRRSLEWRQSPPACDWSMMKTFFGTKFAASPEIWNHEPYTKSVDLWGIGVILYYMLLGQQPFSDLGGVGELAERVMEGRMSRPEPYYPELSEGAKDLIQGLLHIESAKRLDCDQVLAAEWVHTMGLCVL